MKSMPKSSPDKELIKVFEAARLNFRPVKSLNQVNVLTRCTRL